MYQKKLEAEAIVALCCLEMPYEVQTEKSSLLPSSCLPVSCFPIKESQLAGDSGKSLQAQQHITEHHSMDLKLREIIGDSIAQHFEILKHLDKAAYILFKKLYK